MGKDFSELEQRCLDALLKQSGNVAHDLGHVRRVVGNARQLAIEEGARLAVVVPAAWLHDCVVVPKDSPRRKQASQEAAKQAVQWLRDWGWAEELLPDIACDRSAQLQCGHPTAHN